MATSYWILLVLLLLSILSFAGGAYLISKRFQKRITLLIQENRSLEQRINISENLYQQEIKKNSEEQLYRDALAIEKEQRRIADELHDDTVQRMVAVRFRLEQILYFPVHEKVEKEVNDLRNEIETIIAALRFLIKGLTQPRFEQHSFSYLIQELVNKLSSMHHQTILFEVVNPELESSFSPQVKQELFYLVHEPAHNFMKYSTGFTLTITLTWGPNLIIDVKDNGQGLVRGRGFGMGMISMTDRAKRIHTKVDFIKTSIGGFHIRFTIQNDPTLVILPMEAADFDDEDFLK
jgi:signal transduction histidine kinase